MTKLQIALTIISHTALSVGAGGSAGTIADKSIVRDGWGRPIIPGSQVKGKIRWGAEQLLRGIGQNIPSPFDESPLVEQDKSLIRVLFGSPDHRSPLHFADLAGLVGNVEQMEQLRTSPEQHRSQIRPSVSINRRRGVAEDARLLFQETAIEQTRFHHERAIQGVLETPEHAALLWAGIKLTDRWGGAKSRGLGWSAVEVAVFLNEEKLRDTELTDQVRALLRKEDT